MHRAALLKACKILGSQSELARKIKVSQPRLNAWLNSGKAIPYHYVIAIEQATQGQVTRSELAPMVNPLQPFSLEIFDRLSRLEKQMLEVMQLVHNHLVSDK